MAVDKERTVKEAKRIMDLFLEALKDAEEIESEFFIRRDHNTRDHFNSCYDDSFRERFFGNIPVKKGDCLQAEKKRW